MKQSGLERARNKLELFSNDKYSAKGIMYLEDGLCDLKDIVDNKTAPDPTKKIVSNIIDRLYRDTIEESKRIFDTKPLALIQPTAHWIEVMLCFKACGWETPEEFKDAGRELSRLKRIIENHGGHISREYRKEIVDDEGIIF